MPLSLFNNTKSSFIISLRNKSYCRTVKGFTNQFVDIDREVLTAHTVINIFSRYLYTIAFAIRATKLLLGCN